MTRARKMIIPALAGCLLTIVFIVRVASGAALEGNPYAGIVDRNVFQLRPPPPPATNVPPPVAPPPVITLTGITTILGNKRALLKWSVPPKPGQPPKEQSYILTEGQREDDVEVIEIDEKAGSVRVRNHGQDQSLNFTDNGAKLVVAPAAMAAPASLPGINPGVAPAAGVPGAAPSAIHTIPQRTLRLPSAPGTAAVGPGGVGVPGNASVQPQGEQLSAEAQAILIEAQRLDAQQRGSPAAKILPPLPPAPTLPGRGNPNAGQPQ